MDFEVSNQGSVIGVKPVSESCQEWFDENVSYDSYQVMGGYVYGDHRMMADLIDGMIAEGFVCAA